MTQNTSLAGFALTQEQAFSFKADDYAFVKAGKFTVQTAITTSSFALAIVETALSAIATAILSPSNLTRFNGTYKTAANHTRDSAQTVVQAARRTFGIDHKTAVAPNTLDKIRVQKFVEVVKTYANKASEKASPALVFGKEHKRPFIAASLTAALAAAYFFAPEGIVFESVCYVPCTLFNAGIGLRDRAVELVFSNNETVVNFQDGELFPSEYEGGEITVSSGASFFTKEKAVGGVFSLATLGGLYGCLRA